MGAGGEPFDPSICAPIHTAARNALHLDFRDDLQLCARGLRRCERRTSEAGCTSLDLMCRGASLRAAILRVALPLGYLAGLPMAPPRHLRGHLRPNPLRVSLLLDDLVLHRPICTRLKVIDHICDRRLLHHCWPTVPRESEQTRPQRREHLLRNKLPGIVWGDRLPVIRP